MVKCLSCGGKMVVDEYDRQQGKRTLECSQCKRSYAQEKVFLGWQTTSIKKKG